MAIKDKLMFWKKKDEPMDDPFANAKGGEDPFAQHNQPDPFAAPGMGEHNPMEMSGMDEQMGFGEGHDPDSGMSAPMQQPSSFGQQRQFSQPMQQMQQQQSYPHEQAMGRDMEMIDAKLDAIRAQLDSINQRLLNLERIAGQDQNQQQRRMW